LNQTTVKSPSQGVFALLAISFSGLPMGLAFLRPEWAGLAWMGVALLAFGLKFEVHKAWLISGVIIGSCISHWLGHPWYLESVVRWSSGLWPLWQVALLWSSSTLFAEVLPGNFLILLWICGPRKLKRIPLFVWLPLAWWLGEEAVFWSFNLCQHLLLYSQWQIQPVLRAVGFFGWVPALLLCLGLSAALGEALYLKHYKWGILPLLGGLLLFCLPPLPQHKDRLAGMGAVHLQSYFDLPNSAPSELDILVWPEVAFSRRPRLNEGLNQKILLPPPLPSQKTWHVVGYKTLGQLGPQNSVLVMNAQGQVWGMRSKQLLFPGWERPVLGVGAPHAQYFVPGKMQPLLAVPEKKLVPLLCLEAFDRRLAHEGVAAGGEVLTVSAIDYGMTQSELGYQQFVGIAVLLAVENRLPLVRSSLGGPAALIDANGEVLAMSHFGEKGILVYSPAR